jgi:hypothetical protein
LHYFALCYFCLLEFWATSQRNEHIFSHASQHDCQVCSVTPQCCPNMEIRKIDRSPQEPARDVARAIAKTDAYLQSRKDRKKVEMLFAHLKRIMKLDRLRLRDLSGAKDEFLMAATAQNLRRMAKWLVPMAGKREMAPEEICIPGEMLYLEFAMSNNLPQRR